MRRLLLTAVLLALVGAPSASAAPVFYVWGKGWGHGIGMPQYGAQGYALHGKSYRWILDHFYRDTWAGTASKTKIRVLLDVGRSSVTVSSGSAWTVEDGRGRSWELPAGSRTVRPRLEMRAGGKKRKLSAPVTFDRVSGGPLSVDGQVYRGSVVLHKPGSGLSVVNHVGLQPYLQGVVPDEMPPSWHPEALKAQAVAARSYGLANLTTGTYFDVYDDTRDQVYNGVLAEEPSTNAAIRATANEVRRWSGGLATTFFYSSSGGRTAANEDVWGSSPLPYLRSVRDRWDTISPHHSWGPTRFARSTLDARLASYVAGTLRDVVVSVNPSRRAGTVVLRGSGGETAISGESVRYLLALKSSWFRVGVLNLVPGRGKIERGQSVMLRGVARSVGTAWLESRLPGGEWKERKELELTDDARFATRVSPSVSREYRVASARGTSNGRLVKVEAAAGARPG